MAVSNKKRKQILRAYPRQSAEELARELGLKLQEVRQVIQGAEKQPAVVAAAPALLLRRRSTRAAVVAALLVVFGLLIYHGAFSHPFHFDDRPNILNNYFVQVRQLSWPNLRQALFNSALPFRPVANLSLVLNFYFGEKNPRGYQVVNQAIHLLNGILVYLFLAQLLGYLSARGRFRARFHGPPDLVALLAALLWFVNPVQSQSVVYIIQRMNSLAALFYLLGLIAWFRFRLLVQPELIRLPKAWAYLAATVLCFLLALGSKEIAATFPLALLLIEVFIFRDLDPVWLRRYAWTLIPALGFLVLFGILVLGPHPIQALELKYAGRDFTLAQRLLTQPRVIWHYLLIYLLPVKTWMNLDYDIPISTLALAPLSTLPALVGILALLALAVRYARRLPLLSFAILWFFLHLAIESTIIPLELAYDHRLYLPSVGLAIAFALFLSRLAGSVTKTMVLGGLVAALWAALAFLRVGDWRTEESLWRDCVRKSPLKARTITILGDTYGKADNPRRAEPLYLRAIQLDPHYEKAYNNLTIIYNMTGRRQEAVDLLEKVLGFAAELGHPYNNLGKNLLELRRFQEALDAFQKAEQFLPYNSEVHNNLAAALGNLHRNDEAEVEFKRSIELDPDMKEAYNNLAGLYNSQGQLDKAVATLQTYLRRHPNDPAVRNTLDIYQKALSAGSPSQ